MLNGLIFDISTHKPKELAETAMSAAVMLLVLYEQDQFSVVITKRSNTVETYANQYCLPGGMRDIDDDDLKLTAIREVYEELGFNPQYYQIVGQLDDLPDRYGNVVRPFVAIMKKADFDNYSFINVDEIAEVILLQVQELKNIKPDPRMEKYTKRQPFYCYESGDMLIWGLTAFILKQFANLILKK